MKQENWIEIIQNNTEAMNKVANAVDVLNDQNNMHYQKDDIRDSSLNELVASNKAMQKIFYISIMALIVLAGAEKLFQFIKI